MTNDVAPTPSLKTQAIIPFHTVVDAQAFTRCDPSSEESYARLAEASVAQSRLSVVHLHWRCTWLEARRSGALRRVRRRVGLREIERLGQRRCLWQAISQSSRSAVAGSYDSAGTVAVEVCYSHMRPCLDMIARRRHPRPPSMRSLD